MSEPREALRGYVHFLHEREGVRQVKLTRAAREGLAKVVAKGRDGSPVSSDKSSGREETRVPAQAAVARSATANLPPAAQRAAATNEPPLEISGATKAEQLRHLAERASVCVKCPHLVARRHTVVFGVAIPRRS